MDDVSGVTMLVDWKYTYKRRGWTIEYVIASIDSKNYESFVAWHNQKGITSPTEVQFNNALPKPEATKPAKPKTKRKRTTRAKQNETRKARKK